MSKIAAPVEDTAVELSIWPDSCCVECGKHIPSGLMQECSKGGFCSWRIPEAVRSTLEFASTRTRELEKRLAEAEGYLSIACADMARAGIQPYLRKNIAAFLSPVSEK